MKYTGNDDDHFELPLRKDENQPGGDQRIHSSYDIGARYCNKNSTEWVGYKVVLTETYDEDLPPFVINVETAVADEADVCISERIHQSLMSRQLLPPDSLVDAGFIDVEHLVQSPDEFGVTLCGPVQTEAQWQAVQNEGFGSSAFHINWEPRTVTCPHGKTTHAWKEHQHASGQSHHRISLLAA